MSMGSKWTRLMHGQDLWWILRNHGFRGTIRWLRRSVPYYFWLHFSPAGHRERDFDKIHGVETEGMVPRWQMGDVGPNRRFAVQYVPTKPRKLYQLLDSLHIRHEKFTFIDIGSGKGRALLLASRYPFRRSLGVEFVPKLCEIARRNLEICRCPAEILCMDATQYIFPNDPLVIYLCNPFGLEPLQQLAKNLERSLAIKPRPVYVVYWNALHVQPFAESPYFTQIAFRPDEFAIYKSALDS